MTRRRAVLASIGTAALAGCLAGDQGATPTDTLSGEPADDTEVGDPEPPDSIDSDWPMPGHDPGRTNVSPEAAGPTGAPAELWHVATDAALFGPVVADGTLYVGGEDGVVRAFEARSGAEQWREPVGAPAGTPRVLEGRVHVPTTEGVVTLEAANGAPIWHVDASDRAGLLVAPHGAYYVAAGEPPAVVGLRRTDGSERWRADIDEPWTSTLFAGEGQVLVGTGGHWDRPWRFDSETGAYLGDRRPPQGGADFVVEEFVQDGTVYAGTKLFRTISATRMEDGGREWRRSFDAAGCWTLAGGTDRFYAHAECLDGRGLYALSKRDGRTEWSSGDVTDLVGRPAVAAETVVVLTESALRCYDPSDGSERWSHPAAGIGERFVLVDDLLFTTSGDTVRALRGR